MEDKVYDSKEREVWISYRDDSETIVSGFVILVEQTPNYLKFKTNQGRTFITISYSRLIKLKEKTDG